MNGYSKLKPKDGKLTNVVIETPKGSPSKFNLNEELGVFELGGVMPSGSMFPFDFGMVPGTKGDDGDPLDVLVLMDYPTFPGCLIRCRLIGIIEAKQTNKKKKKLESNDRMIAVAEKSNLHRDVRALSDLTPAVLDEIEHFFISYNAFKGQQFKVTRRGTPAQAEKALKRGIKKA
jgi:inorganic pyrophosphatase